MHRHRSLANSAFWAPIYWGSVYIRPVVTTRRRKKARACRAMYVISLSDWFKKNFCSGGATRSRTGLDGFAIRCITDLLSRQYVDTRRSGASLIECAKPSSQTKTGSLSFPFLIWSGRRVSNSRPQPWQGCALPTELLPHILKLEPFCVQLFRLIFVKTSTKRRTRFYTGFLQSRKPCAEKSVRQCVDCACGRVDVRFRCLNLDHHRLVVR